MRRRGLERTERWWRRALELADRHDEHRRSAAPGSVAAAVAAVKLTVVGAGALVVGPAVAGVAARNTAALADLTWRYPDLVADLLAGSEPGPPFERVRRVRAGDRYVITSDLHRGPAGITDWPGIQDVDRLYLALVGWYADRDWALVENGDVEDFWMVGGSTYGVTYELARWVGHAVRTPSGRAFLAEVHAEHLRRIVDHHRELYDLIDSRLHRRGRYHRVIGNHDDAYLDEAVVDQLRQVHTGLDVVDAVVLEGPGGGVGLITHGHHTDPWNAPHRAGLGKLGTWLGSAVADAPFTSTNPGLPTEDQSRHLLAGEHPSVLTEVSTLFGANRDLFSMDEVMLHDAWRERFGPAGPWLVLGHTHLPLIAPVDTRTRWSWRRYLNSGCGVFDGLVTAVEWDGSGSGAGGGSEPEVGLVVWHWAGDDTPPGAVVTEIDGRPVARRRLRRGLDGRHIVVADDADDAGDAGRARR